MIRKQQPLLVLAAGLVLIAMAVVAGWLLLGNDDDSPGVTGAVKEKTPSVSTAGTAGGPDAITRLTPAEASLNLNEIPGDFEVDVSNTFAMNITTFASSYWFKSNTEGEAKAREWQIIGGFQVYYQPKGLAADVLRGAPYIHIETYEFASVTGAQKAWAHFDNFVKNTPGSEAVEARPLANSSAAYRFIEGTVATSETVAVYHRFSFRRGNTIVTVTTWGAEPYMNIDPARNIAAAIDDKLLGSRPAVEPTPIPTPSFPGFGN